MASITIWAPSVSDQAGKACLGGLVKIQFGTLIQYPIELCVPVRMVNVAIQVTFISDQAE